MNEPLLLSEYHPVLEENNHITYTTHGDTIFSYRIQLNEPFSLDEKDYDALHNLWYSALKNLSRCIVIKQDLYQRREFNVNGMPSETYLEQVNKQHAQGKFRMEHQCTLSFILPGSGYLNSTHIRNPFKRLLNEKSVALQVEREQHFSDEVEQAVAFLSSSRLLSVQPVQSGYARKQARLYFNGLQEDLYCDTIREGASIRIGERNLGSFVIRANTQLPEAVTTCQLDQRTGQGNHPFFDSLMEGFGLTLPYDHIYTQVFYLEDHVALKEEIKAKNRWFERLRQFDPENMQGYKTLSAYLEQMTSETKIRLVRAHFNLSFFADSQAAYQDGRQRILTLFKERDITPYLPVGNEAANIFFNSFYANISQLNKPNFFTCDLQQGLCLLTQHTNYIPDREGIYFSDRLFNTPLLQDVWDQDKQYIKARNFFIVAPTGEGKSVLANHIFSQLLDQGYYLVINDLGGSYEKLALLYPETSLYIQYTPGEPIGINPFHLAEQEEPGSTKINELCEFIRVLYKRDEGYEEKERVSVRKLLQFYYHQVSQGHSFPHFYAFVTDLYQRNALASALELEENLFDAQTFLHVCSEFVGQGTYAFLFPESGPALEIDLSGKRLVILEFDKAQDDPLLISILLNLSNTIDRKLIWEDRSKRGYIFYDECAKQMKFPNVLNTLEWKTQAIRKQEGGLGMVLQTPNQIPRNSTAESIIDNVQLYFILHHTGGYDEVVKRFRFSEHEKGLLESIRNNFSAAAKEQYSEFLFKRARQSKVVRLNLSEKALCAYLSEGAKHQKIMEYYERCGDMHRAIEEYLKPEHL